ncbi:MAG: ATP-dependent helicase HrpB, partial [Sphingomonas sp.]|nr:ATP-dependent helicase HrpB [Sphingomonas sp.]
GGAAAEVAILLTERGLGGKDVDLAVRRSRWRSDRGPKAEGARRMAQRWVELSRLTAGSKRSCGEPAPSASHAISVALALAFPDRLSRRRDSTGEQWQSVGGRGFRLDSASPLARSEWLAVGEVAGAASGARIMSAAAIEVADAEALFGDAIEAWSEISFDPATSSINARKGLRLGTIRLAAAPDPNPDPEAITAGLIAAIRRHGLSLLPWTGGALALRHRAAFAALHDGTIPSLDDATLLARLDEWLAPLLAGKRRLDTIDGLQGALDGLLGFEATRLIDRLAPTHFTSPAGSSHPIDYAAPAGPAIEVRAQALYGLTTHPAVAGGRVPLTVAITSPAHRPIQTTRDLPAFWTGSWRDVAKEMRGRYPRHLWPDDPAAAAPTLRTKRAQR